ncbi:deoxyribose-phosphate aldolase [Streptococcus ferus]|uniref:deoxyribose-phosphate aldolase n=1 Tax=Streptococcus ferus TaxID=1345 RepID=UPI00235734A7|nr:deoxyribose-phosphate aldolase [Streptococcus ferus]
MAAYTIDQLAQLIDHTNLKADAKPEAIKQLCQEAKDYHFKMVAVNQVQSELCAQELTDTDIHVGAAIAFPLGQTSIAAKVFEAQDAIAQGAQEIDYVINLTQAKAGNLAYIKEEMAALVSVCRQAQVICKVIFETAYLEKEEIIAIATIAKEVKPDFIKTSTGFAATGARAEDVRLMKETVGDAVKVKAAGGIRDLETLITMVQNGAERIGTSAGIAIIEELKEFLNRTQSETIVL